MDKTGTSLDRYNIISKNYCIPTEVWQYHPRTILLNPKNQTNMKKRNYMPPTVTAADIFVERGFATSDQYSIDDWQNDNF